MKRHYNEPDIQVEYFIMEDVLTTSNGSGDIEGPGGAGGEHETPIRPIG